MGDQGEQKRVFSTSFKAFSFGADFDDYVLRRGILSNKCASVGGFVDKNMVFGDYVNEYSSDEDEK